MLRHLPVNLYADAEYDLRICEDLGTRGNVQWFYFGVRNTRKGRRVRFNLVNHNKSDSLFNYGTQLD